MERALGDRRQLPLRPHQDPGPDLRHRHPPADGQRVTARRPRVLLHPHRHHRPLQAHARPRGLVPDGLGRQRPADRAPGPELLRGALRSVHALRRRVRRRRPRRPRSRCRSPAPTSWSCASSSPRRTSGPSRSCGAEWACRSTGPTPTRPSGGSPSGRRSGASCGFWRRGEAYTAVAPTLWDVDFQHRRVSGRARGPRTDRRLSPSCLPPTRRRRRVHRHHPPGAAGRLRGGRGPPRRRPLPATVRLDGHHAAVRRRGAGHGPRVGRSGQGIGDGDDLHLRRRHRRGLVAGAGPADQKRHRA